MKGDRGRTSSESGRRRARGRLSVTTWGGALVTGIFLLAGGILDGVYAVVQVLPDATYSVDGRSLPGGKVAPADSHVKEVVAAFGRAEEAVQRQDVDALLQFYAPAFNYHGLKPEGVRRIWTEVFEYYRNVSSTHLFSDIRLIREGDHLRAEVTCTGGLYGTDRRSGKAVTLDSWFREVHYLISEEGRWRLLGNKGDAPTVAPFSSVPHHPLF